MPLPIRNLKEYEDSVLRVTMAKLESLDRRVTADRLVTQLKIAVRFLEYAYLTDGVCNFHLNTEFSKCLREIHQLKHGMKKGQVVETHEKTKTSIRTLILKINGARK